MTMVSTDFMDRITKVLNSTSQANSFTVAYENGNSFPAVITFASSSEYRFIIQSASGGTYTTSESPGIHSDATEIFQRAEFESCMNALEAWTIRIADIQRDWILDEFGGVADRNPSLNQA